MADSLINGNLVTDTTGRVRYSGFSSGIDFEKIVEATIAAKRIPVDRMEAQIETNKEKITALTTTSSLMQSLKTSLSTLYGKITFGNSGSIFNAKSAFATTSRSDGGAASSAANLIGVTTTNAAEATSHEIEVLQIAKAHKVGSASFSSSNENLGIAAGGAAGSVAGTFDINGTTITVGSGDTLADLRDRINNANTGSAPTGVSASIVTVGANQNILVLTAAKTGTPIVLDNETGSVLSELGVSVDGGASFANELQVSQKALLKADGLLDPSRYESALVASASAPLSTYGVTGSGNSFELRDGGGALLGSVSYDSTDTLDSLAAKISAVAGVSAEVVEEGGKSRLAITSDSGNTIRVANDSNNLTAGLSLERAAQIIERESNTVSDLFSGITLSLFQAEPGTVIKVDVERDLSAVKTAITDFTDAYNELKTFLNQQNLTDSNTNEKSEDAGPLYRSPVLANIESSLSRLLGNGANGVSAEFSVLAQIGIDFVNNDSLSDPLANDTLTIDETKLDEALLNNPDDIRRLFAFDFSSSDPRLQLMGFDGKATYDADGYALNIGQVGSQKEVSTSVVDETAVLGDAGSVSATTSGQFMLNGTAIAYDVTVDGLDDIVGRINLAGIPGISAAIGGSPGAFFLQITATGSDPVDISGDTGDLVASLALTTQGTFLGSANVGGAGDGSADGTATVAGRMITITDQSGAQGLQLFYNGDEPLSNVQIDFTVGFGAAMFFELDRLLAPNTGIVDAEIDTLNGQNMRNQERADFMVERLEYQREKMLERFVKMEQALASLENQRSSLTQIIDAMTQDK